MRKHIPNLITCMNVTSGAFAIFLAMYGYLPEAACLVLLAMIFDFFDGLAARLLHVKSELGKELDSLADVVSFGVAPAVLAHFLMLEVLPEGAVRHFAELAPGMKVMLFCPSLIPAFSAYRLAKFNLDTRQVSSFIGMPTPANALFWVTLVFGSVYTPELYGRLFGNVYTLGVSALILSVLLISELPMFSLKISGFGWRENKNRYLYFIALIVLAVLFKAAVLLFVVPLYVFFAVVSALVKFTTPNH